MGVFHWIKELFSHWQYWASGGGFGGAVLLIVYLVQLATGWKMNTKWQLLILLVFFVIGASYMLWRDDQKEKAKLVAANGELQRHIDSLTLSAITGEIQFAILGQQAAGSHAAIIVEVKNEGAPSGIVPSSWHLTATDPEGKKHQGWANTLKEKNLDFCLSPNKLMRFVRSDALYLKTESPLGRNDSKQGMLWFGFPDLPALKLKHPSTLLLLEADTCGFRGKAVTIPKSSRSAFRN